MDFAQTMTDSLISSVENTRYLNKIDINDLIFLIYFLSSICM